MISKYIPLFWFEHFKDSGLNAQIATRHVCLLPSLVAAAAYSVKGDDLMLFRRFLFWHRPDNQRVRFNTVGAVLGFYVMALDSAKLYNLNVIGVSNTIQLTRFLAKSSSKSEKNNRIAPISYSGQYHTPDDNIWLSNVKGNTIADYDIDYFSCNSELSHPELSDFWRDETLDAFRIQFPNKIRAYQAKLKLKVRRKKEIIAR